MFKYQKETRRNMISPKLFSILLLAILFVTILFAGCSSVDNIVPLPSLARHYSPNGMILLENQITMPFPATDKFRGGEERWFLDADNVNHLILRVTWKGQDVATFPINGIGVTQGTGEIALGGKNFLVVDIYLNSDDLPDGSGLVTLQEY
jgi:hypothetical protein